MACATAPSAVPESKSEKWTCDGELVPPTGYEQSTAFVSIAEGKDAAVEKAKQRLAREVCGGADCPVKIWKTGAGNGQFCAMAVIKLASAKSLDAEFDRVAGELLQNVRYPIVILDPIEDENEARAAWLGGRLKGALMRRKVHILEDVETIAIRVHGKAFERHDGDDRVIEVQFEALVPSATNQTSSVVFPVTAAPLSARARTTSGAGESPAHQDSSPVASYTSEPAPPSESRSSESQPRPLPEASSEEAEPETNDVGFYAAVAGGVGAACIGLSCTYCACTEYLRYLADPNAYGNEAEVSAVAPMPHAPMAW